MKSNNSFKRVCKITLSALILLVVITMIINGVQEETTVESDFPRYRNIERSIPVNGKIQPVKYVSISPEVSGEIDSIFYAEGCIVKAGETIIKIKPDLYNSLVERAEASLGEAKSSRIIRQIELENASKRWHRDSILMTKGTVSVENGERSEMEYRMAIANLNAAEYQILSAEASLKEACENLQKTTITAPIDGIITSLEVKIGERVVGTSQMAGTELFRMADFSKMEIVSMLSESDIPKISRNDSVRIEIDAFPEHSFKGFVRKIANSSKIIGTNTEQVSTFEVRIGLMETDASSQDSLKPEILPGMSASGFIIVEKKSDILTVPMQAVFSKDHKNCVWVIDDDNTVTAREISEGIRDLKYIEVISGLTNNDKIVTAPYSVIGKLNEGDKVKDNE